MKIVREVYDIINSALWAVGAAFAFYFLFFIAPYLPEYWRQAESIRALNIAAENSALCEKWGMKRGTNEHLLCTIDLQNLRDEIKQEEAADFI